MFLLFEMSKMYRDMKVNSRQAKIYVKKKTKIRRKCR